MYVNPSNIPVLRNFTNKKSVPLVIDRLELTDYRICSNDGERGYLKVFNTKTGDVIKTYMGSWGGSNIFTKTIADDVGINVEIEPGIGVIVGHQGGMNPGVTMVYMHASDVPADALPKKVELDETLLKVLSVMQYTSAYRKQYWNRAWGELGLNNPHLLKLVELGLLKKAGAGYSLTPDGKESLKKHPDYNF